MVKNEDKLIYKSNDLIQKFKNTFSLQEMKILNYIIANIKSPKYDKEFNAVTVSIRELAREIGYSDEKIGGKTYLDIKNALAALNRQQSDFITIEGYDGRPIETIIRWLERPIIDREKGIIILKLDDLLKPYLLNLSKNFTKYELLISTKMQSKYSLKLYELLKSWEKVKMGQKSFELDALKEYLDVPKSYSNFNNLAKKALDPAINEINEITDLIVSYSTEKKGKKVIGIIFHISKKEVKEDPPVIDSGLFNEDSPLKRSAEKTGELFDWIDAAMNYDDFIRISRLAAISDINEKKAKIIFSMGYDILEKEGYDFTDPKNDDSLDIIVGIYISRFMRKIELIDDVKDPYKYLVKILENKLDEINQQHKY